MTDASATPGSDRSIDLAVEVPGTPEEVWRAIATGPGISSWYVPHEVEERQGGAAVARFGPGPEMEVSGRVAAWDPPSRIVFDGGEGVEGLAFEWLIEAAGGGTCVVRLVNTGFGHGSEWDDQYDAMTEGWSMFLSNLKAHLDHFGGQTGYATLPTVPWTATPDAAWASLTNALGIPPAPAVGDRIEVAGEGAPALAGLVLDATPRRLTLLLDEPCPGTALLAAEGYGGGIHVSVWAYLYGPQAPSVAPEYETRWRTWLTEQGDPQS